jgi:hypothetical protein
MSKIDILRHAMTRWNLFIVSCVFVAGLAMKAGAPLYAVLVGVALAALANLAVRSLGPSPR